jgi:thioredoxin 1
MKGNFATIINEDKPVIVDFHAVWCAPCKMQTPVLQELARDLGDKVRVIKVDVDQNQEIAGQYKIQSVPTLIVFRNGIPVWRQSGVVGKNQLMNILNQNC